MKMEGLVIEYILSELPGVINRGVIIHIFDKDTIVCKRISEFPDFHNKCDVLNIQDVLKIK